jgi:hypothetical protein
MVGTKILELRAVLKHMVNRRKQRGDRGIRRVDLVQMEAQHEAMMIRHAAAKRLAQLLGRSLDPRIREGRQFGRIDLTGDHSFDHRPSALADKVGDDRVELDVGDFQDLLKALGMATLLAGQLLARAQQLTQFLDFLLRNKSC